MQTINVITPCSRPKNLRRMVDSIFKDCSFFHINWFVGVDTSKVKDFFVEADIPNILYPNYGFFYDFKEDVNSVVGNAQRNVCLDRILNNKVFNGWCMFIDDDNSVHPNFYWTFFNDLINNPFHRVFIYSQDRKSDLMIILNPKHVGVGYKLTDSSQFIVHSDVIGNIRWKVDDYNADGLFIQEIYNKNSVLSFLSDFIVSNRNSLKD